MSQALAFLSSITDQLKKKSIWQSPMLWSEFSNLFHVKQLSCSQNECSLSDRDGCLHDRRYLDNIFLFLMLLSRSLIRKQYFIYQIKLFIFYIF